ncbi:hypothetical protein [[Clostridium] polysaccharolyticum]|uniref:Uncharacterized protein n=1 Tax=[Clostridium] polysaccharolyticum TaxID=29364 RepID=A0A1H9ZN34_9FIRM|nr:hypothetical protein [[Clostridium] polysaccharolyticum]SES83135.1 hypothetical protein SAMN04487772_10422 [[Clostridium] polysaccharolyticum]
MNIQIKAIKPIENKRIKPFTVFQPKKTDEEAVTRHLNQITAKLKAGKRLTAEEKAFLLRHSPALYQTAKRVEIQREALKNQLEHARSKEEAAAIYSSALGGVSKKDPDREYILAAIQDEMKTFQSTDSYKKLPATSKEADGKPVYHPYKNKKEKTPDWMGFYGKHGEYL